MQLTLHHALQWCVHRVSITAQKVSSWPWAIVKQAALLTLSQQHASTISITQGVGVSKWHKASGAVGPPCLGCSHHLQLLQQWCRVG